MKKFSSVISLSFLVLLLLVGCDNKSSSDNKEVDYKLQKQCSEDSEEYFKKRSWESVTYQSHYNKTLNKCFILVILSTSNTMGLIDVIENKHYGSFYLNEQGIKNCNVLEKKCNSEEEWNSLVKSYMEE